MQYPIISLKKRESRLLKYVVFLLSCSCYCYVSLPCGAMGWSVLVAFPSHTHLIFVGPASQILHKQDPRLLTH